MTEPSHAEPRRITVGQVRRVAFAVLAVDFVALAGLGLWLAWRYEPGGGGISSMHQMLGVVAVVAAFIGAAAAVLDHERSANGILPAVVILGVLAAIYLTGPSLAWDSIAARGETIEHPRGSAVVFNDRVGAVGIGDREMTPKRYRALTYLHTVALPAAVLSMAGVGLWAARRRYEPAHAEPEPDADDADDADD